MSRVLLVNPWIEDFAAYDLWARPLGLLLVGAMLKAAGAEVELIDCLAREGAGGTDRFWGTGKYRSEPVDKPAPVAWAPRLFHRYGLSEAAFHERLARLDPPEWVFVTCLMTYWYHGAFQTARLLRQALPRARLVLGGVYANLCADHARRSGIFNEVVTEKTLPDLAGRLAALTGLPVRAPAEGLPPAYHLYRHPLKHAAILTGWGCPFHCSYCATPLMYPRLQRKSPDDVCRELESIITTTGAADIAFYDDALLVDREHHFQPLLEQVIEHGVKARFHLPNAIHPRLLDNATCRLMKAAGFVTVRLGFESLSAELLGRSCHKSDQASVERGVAALFAAGFTAQNVGAYIMFGAPGLSLATTLADIDFVHQLGLKANLACFSPIPGTPDFERFRLDYPDVADEPLLQNNTVTLLRLAKEYRTAQDRVRELNARLGFGAIRPTGDVASE